MTRHPKTPGQFLSPATRCSPGAGPVGVAGALGSLTSPVISTLTGGLVAGSVVLGLTLPAFARYRRQPPG
jgi:hypothetical protein